LREVPGRRSEDIAEIHTISIRRDAFDLVAAYRKASNRRQYAPGADTNAAAEDAEDTPENGNAVNNQSIVLTIGQGGGPCAACRRHASFAKPQLSDDGVKEEMQALHDLISADVLRNGPFGFVKLCHHGATNGQNAALLKEWGAGLFGISTGSGSTKHPTPPTLAALAGSPYIERRQMGTHRSERQDHLQGHGAISSPCSKNEAAGTM